MEAKEAIEVLTNERKYHHSFPTDIIGKADQLGIEALEAYLKSQEAGWYPPGYKLPSETED